MRTVVDTLDTEHQRDGNLNRHVIQLCITAFFWLMRPAEYLGYSSRDDDGARSSRSEAFRLEDITFTIRGTAMLATAASLNEVNISDITYATLMFTDQKNAVRGEQVGHWATGDPTLCPCKALARIVMHIRSRPVSNDTPICTYHANDGTQRTVKATHITNALRHAADRLKDSTGIPPELISTRSLRPGGATALLCANIDKQSIHVTGLLALEGDS